MLELMDSRSGPPVRDTEAGEPTVLFEGDETRTRRRPLVCRFPNGFKPPRLSVVAESWISGSLLDVDRSDLAILSKLNSALMVLLVDVSSGPANAIFDGATSAFVSPQHAPVSLTVKKLPPPAWRVGPALNVDPVN
jgi:hypothetical protein